jgi:lon-related putative ATP-dependent protease
LKSMYRLKPRDLRKSCNPKSLKFETTKELLPLKGIIGQDRALRSLEFALTIDHQGYNVYLAGPLGTGKTTLAKYMLENKARQEPCPSDWCYVYNFENPDCPDALELPAGKGKQFKKDLEDQVEKIIARVAKALEEDEFDYKRGQIMSQFMEKTNDLYMRAEEEARKMGFGITRSEHGISSYPLKDGEAMNQGHYSELSEDERAELMKRSYRVQEMLAEAFREYKELEKSIKEQIKNLERDTARAASAPYFDELMSRYNGHDKLTKYLTKMQEDLLEHFSLIIKQDDSNPLNFLRINDRRNLLRRYQVNLLVDNSELTHAPVIFESNPTYSNLFGQIEYESEFGVLATDFSKIKAGTIHKANGGYLVLHMFDLAKHFYVWDTLKRVLKNQEIRVETISRMFGISNSETLQPEPIPVKLKVILIGDPLYYHLLYIQDEEFQKLFKIKADFDTEMDRSRKHINDYARLIASVCESEGLRHFDREAVAQIVDYGSRMVENQNKLTTMFNKLVEVIYEANTWAERDNASIVSGSHVLRAINEKRFRASLIEDHMHNLINKETILIDVHGSRIGQINGLAVYQLGDHQFGKPVRITAKTFMGESGLVNIEREIRMSGSIHSKGVLTLNGYMGAQYAQDKPLSLTASLTFEQSYQGIEGDSASSAELYALLSSLSDMPIYQGIAVTGSVNQNGEIQPVGGVNQKIEGFFRVCKNFGLNGKQGVIIPRQNIHNLMLDQEVVEAVRQKKFNIWAVEHIDQGLEILTGVEAGIADENGKFPDDSIHGRVNKKLSEWNDKRRWGRERNQRPSAVRRRRNAW